MTLFLLIFTKQKKIQFLLLNPSQLEQDNQNICAQNHWQSMTFTIKKKPHKNLKIASSSKFFWKNKLKLMPL